MPETVLLEVEEQMEKAVTSMEREFKRVRSGRATPDMVEHIHVDYYGSMTALPQVANVSAPEPRLLVVKAFDNSILGRYRKSHHQIRPRHHPTKRRKGHSPQRPSLHRRNP